MATALDRLRSEVAHQQQRDRIRSAYRQLDRLQAERDRLDAMPWHRRPEGRAGALVAAIRDARQHITELEAEQRAEGVYGIPPTIEVSEPPRDRPGLPPSWYLEGPAARTPQLPQQHRRPARHRASAR